MPSQSQPPAPRAEKDAFLKLLYITVSLPFGPGETFFIPEIAELLRRGCELLLVPRSPHGAVLSREAAGFQHISLRKPIVSPGILAAAACEVLRHPLCCLRAGGLLLHSRNLVTLLKNLLVYPKALWLGRLARSLRVDHIHAQWASTTAAMALVASAVSGVPWSCTAHRGDIAANNLLQVKLAKASFVRFISQSGLRMAEQLGVISRRYEAPVIHVGVSLPAAIPAAAGGAGPTRLFCPANLIPVKGHKYLLQALAILHDRGVDCRLELAGEGESNGELLALAHRLPCADRVAFLGQLPHEAIIERYRTKRVDIVVLSSVDLGNNVHEGIPVALMEAMAYGIPVVSTSTGGIPELLEGGAGVIVPPRDPVALAGAIERLILDPALRRRYSERGRRRVEEEFSVESCMARLLDRIARANKDRADVFPERRDR